MTEFHHTPAIVIVAMAAVGLLIACSQSETDAGEAARIVDGKLVVEVVDAASGEALDGASAGIMSLTGEVLAWERESTELAIDDLPPEYYVVAGAPGHEFAHARLTADDPARVSLEPCRRSVVLDIRREADVRAEIKVTRVITEEHGAWMPVAPDGAVCMTRELLNFDGDRIEIAVPAHGKTRIYVQAEDGIASPSLIVPRSEEQFDVLLEGLRTLEFSIPPGTARPELARAFLLHDRVETPPGGRRRVDALLSASWNPLTAEREARVENGRIVVAGVPRAAPFHAAVLADGRWHYAHVGIDDEQVELPESGSSMWLPKRLASAPAGRLFVAPGRLSISTVRFLTRTATDEGRLAHPVHLAVTGGERVIDAASIPAADWVTVYDDERGVAWVRWDVREIAESDWLNEAVELVPPEGCSLRSEVLVRAIWLGADTFHTNLRSDLMTYELSESNGYRIDGLPPGSYRLDAWVDLRDGAGNESRYRLYRSIEVGTESGTPAMVSIPWESE